MFRDHKIITELIETSRKASRVQVDSNQAASRLENCPKPESKRLAAWSRVGQFFFACSSSFMIFLHMFLFSHQNREHPFHFHLHFLPFSSIFMPKSTIQTNTHAFHFH